MSLVQKKQIDAATVRHNKSSKNGRQEEEDEDEGELFDCVPVSLAGLSRVDEPHRRRYLKLK